MRNSWCSAACLLYLLISSIGSGIAAYAETRYVSDVLVVTMREGQGDEYNVIQALRSNTPLEVLEETEEYVRVKTVDGEEGWVRKRYVTSETPKTIIIDGLNAEIARLKAALENLEKEKKRLSDELSAAKEDFLQKSAEDESRLAGVKEKAAIAEKELAALEKSYKALLENSGNVVSLAEKAEHLEQNNMDLEKKAVRLEAAVNKLQKENSDLFRLGIGRWFLYGAGVLLLGMIMGKMFRKKEYY